MLVTVSCHAAFRGYEKPVSFIIEKRKLTITEIVFRSLHENFEDRKHREKFIVRCDDFRLYELIHHTDEERWSAEEVKEHD